MLLSQAILSVRFLSLFIIVTGICFILANLLETYREIDPSYLIYYFQSQLLRPSVAVGIGIILFIFSKTIGRLLTKGINK